MLYLDHRFVNMINWMYIVTFIVIASCISWAAWLITKGRLNPEPYRSADPEPI
jgi:hypothetical protein